MFDFNPDFRGTFPPDKHCGSPLEEREHTKHEMNEVVKRLLAFEARIQDEYNDTLRQVTKDNSIFKDTFATSFTTFTEKVKNEINDFEANVDATIKLLSEGVAYTKDFDEFKKAINTRLDAMNKAFGDSFTDYQTKLTTDVNMFEATVNATVKNFTDGVTNSLQTFRETWSTVNEERLNAQDAKIAEAELYMKTNLTASIRAEISDMYEKGEFDNIVSETVPAEKFLIIDSVTGKIFNVYMNNGELIYSDSGKTLDDYEV